MTTAEGDALKNYFQPSGVPAGGIDRVAYSGSVYMNRGYWSVCANARRMVTPKCGLAIDASTPGTVEVHASFNQNVSGNVRLTVFLLENGIKYNQSNYMNSQAGHEYYQAGNPMIDFIHEDVLRNILTADKFGDVITANAGNEVVKTYNYSLTGFVPANCTIVAFVNVVGGTYTTHEVLNVQKVAVGQVKNWD